MFRKKIKKKPLSKQTIYIHTSGVSGTFVVERDTSKGKIIIIELPDGREFFAPENEFTKTEG